MRAMLAVAVLGLGGSALAGNKTLVVGAGDCRDAVLLGSVRDFQDLARGLLRTELLEHDDVLNRVRPQPTRSLEDLERQIETARSLLYNAQNERALELVNDALAGLERASPEVGPWQATAAALMLVAQLEKNLDRLKDSNEAFRRILRVDPTYRADPDAWPPSTVRAFDAVRKDVQRSKKGLLQVTSGAAGASVFIDGREMGKTPLRLELPVGTYRLSLLAQEAVSFPRVVNLSREDAVQVDMAFEGSLMTQIPLCLNGEDARALKLASAVEAGRLVVLRNTAPKGNPFYVSGVVYDVDRGERVRNAGIRPEQLRDLMMYLFTGKPDISRRRPEWPRRRRGSRRAPFPLRSPPPPPPPLVQSSSSSTSLGRILSFVAVGVGVAAGVGGGVVYAVGDAARVDFASTLRPDGRLPDSGAGPLFFTSVDLMAKVDQNQTIAFTLFGAGAGAIAAGLIGLALYPAAPATVALVPTPSGASLSVSGEF